MEFEFLAIAFLMSMLAVVAVTYPWLRPRLARSRGFAIIPVLVALVVVGLATALYVVVGRPDATYTPDGQTQKSNQTSSQPAVTDSSSSSRVASVASLVGGLEERVAQNPDAGQDWLLLAKSYDHLGRHQEAVNAYEKASALGFLDTTLESKLLTARDAESAAVTIKGHLSIAPAAKDQIKATDTVFILARESDGSPMPLAVLKHSAAELPLEFELSDKQSMVAGRGISSVSNVVIEAKVSETGDALDTRPGFGATSSGIAPESPPFVTLVLDAINNSTVEAE